MVLLVVCFLKFILILFVVEDELLDCGIISLGEFDDVFLVRVVLI